MFILLLFLFLFHSVLLFVFPLFISHSPSSLFSSYAQLLSFSYCQPFFFSLLLFASLFLFLFFCLLLISSTTTKERRQNFTTSSNAVPTRHDRCHIWRSFSITNRWKILEEDETRKQENHRSATKGQLLTDGLDVTCPTATKHCFSSGRAPQIAARALPLASDEDKFE